ncbi:hypothetical protein ON010_g14664 [Phytophthora cinnamomi]|nr:hypothetical protein ON010_g14664 [Phytophthora cinnamomi]
MTSRGHLGPQAGAACLRIVALNSQFKELSFDAVFRMTSSNIGPTFSYSMDLIDCSDIYDYFDIRQLVGHEGRAVFVAAGRVRHHDAAAAPAAPPTHYGRVVVVSGPNAVSINADSESAIFPLFNDAQAYTKTAIALSRFFTGEKRSLSLHLQQLPIISAVASTIYKVQGETLESTVGSRRSES